MQFGIEKKKMKQRTISRIYGFSIYLSSFTPIHKNNSEFHKWININSVRCVIAAKAKPNGNDEI